MLLIFQYSLFGWSPCYKDIIKCYIQHFNFLGIVISNIFRQSESLIFLFLISCIRGSLGFGEEAIQSLPGNIGSQVLSSLLYESNFP